MPLFVLLVMLFSAPALAQADSPLVGAWDAVSQNGEEIPAEFSMWIDNHDDGSGTMHIGEEEFPYTWSHDETAETCTIVADGETMVFKVAIDGDEVTFTGVDNPDDTMVMRRRPE
ncbi:hypothetical protein OT109_10355 [Phycisphaeraceae bacterium D3-23]